MSLACSLSLLSLIFLISNSLICNVDSSSFIRSSYWLTLSFSFSFSILKSSIIRFLSVINCKNSFLMSSSFVKYLFLILFSKFIKWSWNTLSISSLFSVFFSGCLIFCIWGAINSLMNLSFFSSDFLRSTITLFCCSFWFFSP